jgi:dipeptidyl aminopeptidase/acylaminoacyl peptidase
METVSNPQISPDGKRIVYTRNFIDNLNDKWESALWIMNADGSKSRFLARGQSAKWSPDGTRIAYLAEGEPQGRQVFVRWMDAEGGATQITRVDKTPSRLMWAPDSQWISFTAYVAEKETWDIKLPDRPKGAKWTDEPRVIERLLYRSDRTGFLEGNEQIFVVSANGGTPRQLTTGEYAAMGELEEALSWKPDGSEILFSSNRHPGWEFEWRESDIYAVDVKDKTIRQLTHRNGPDTNPEVSPDGRWVAYTGYDQTDDTYIESKLYVMSIDGSGSRAITPNLDRSPQELHWAPDSSGVYFTCEDRGTRNLWIAPLNGEIRQVTNGKHILNISDINSNGQAVGTLTSFHKPGDVVIFSTAKPEIKQLTNSNDDLLRGLKLSEVDEIWFSSLDDFRVQGWLVKPPDFEPSRKYPLILVIHGGPHAMYGVGFNFGWQEHAANGYLVLYINPRGSTGYGGAFGNAIKYAYPGKDFDDLMKGVDTVIARGYVDERNLFVYGCSGGGTLTAWIVGHTDRFAAASANCSVVDWLSFVGTTDGAWWYNRFKKMPWEDPSEYVRRSPLMYVGNVKTPTMLITGVLDMRTPISQAEEYYEALKMRKVPTAMVRLNNEYHGTPSKPSNFIRMQLYLRYWFEKFKRGSEQEPRKGTVSR